jgi:hypothetical protein
MITKSEKSLLSRLDFDRNSKKTETVRNPYTDESCELEPQAVALYDYIKGCEAMCLYSEMNVVLTLFRKLYPNEYYILLD